MSEVSIAEAKTDGIAPAAESAERGARITAISSKVGELVLEGLSMAKNVGETVAGFFYYLSPVPKEFHIVRFKDKLEPIIFDLKKYS